MWRCLKIHLHENVNPEIRKLMQKIMGLPCMDSHQYPPFYGKIMVRFFIINIYYIFNSSKKKTFQVEIWEMVWTNASSKENGTGQCPVWMTQKPRKGDFRGLKSHKFLEGACHWTPLEACTSFRKPVSIYSNFS